MTIPGGLTLLFLIGLLCQAIGLFLHLVALVTAQWSLQGTPTQRYFGLWDMCVDDLCQEYKEFQRTSSLEACQAFAVLAIVVGVAALITCLIYSLMSILNKFPPRIVPLIVMIATAVTLVFIIICVVTWAAGVQKEGEVTHGYSFALSILGGLFVSTGGVLVFIGSN